MKKLFIVLMCIVVFLTGCGYNSTPQPIPSESQPDKNSETVQKDFDFRNSNWGDSIEKVRLSESIKPFLDTDDSLVYNDAKILGLSCSIMYMFYDDRLSNSGYVFSEKHVNKNLYYEDYLKIVKSYEEKYGEPSEKSEEWNDSLYKGNMEEIGMAISTGHVMFITKWETDSTKIGLVLKGDNFEISTAVVYQPLSYKPSTDTNGI